MHDTHGLHIWIHCFPAAVSNAIPILQFYVPCQSFSVSAPSSNASDSINATKLPIHLSMLWMPKLQRPILPMQILPLHAVYSVDAIGAIASAGFTISVHIDAAYSDTIMQLFHSQWIRFSSNAAHLSAQGLSNLSMFQVSTTVIVLQSSPGHNHSSTSTIN